MRERLEEMQTLLLRIQKDDALPINMKVQSLKADVEITKLLIQVIEYDKPLMIGKLVDNAHIKKAANYERVNR